jgi:carboxylesterase
VDPRPFALGDADVGVLLLHGLTGTPHEVRPLADALHEAGYAVRAPLLAGHTDLDALERSTWRDWYASASEAFEHLHDQGRRKVVVLGFSMGSLLTLRLAALRASDLHGVIAISVPLRFPWWQRRAIVAMAKLRRSRFLGGTVGILPKDGGPDIRVMREVDDSPSLEGFPYPALAELLALQDEVADLLPHVRAPALLLHGRYDHTAPVELSAEVSQALGSARVEREVLPRSFHGIGLDLDRDRACASIVRFVDSLGLLSTVDTSPSTPS